jgi:hypothetical protein
MCRVKRFARWCDNPHILEELYFLPYADVLLRQTRGQRGALSGSHPGYRARFNAPLEPPPGTMS